MKKLFILSLIAAAAFASCKKKENTISEVHTYSTPLITVSGAQYYSINVGGALPTISATAYDTFYNENCPVIMDASQLDNSTPGLYAVTLSAKNKYGMKTSTSVYVAVTDVASSLDITGWYQRNGTPGRSAHITKVANGMFMTDNVGGVDTTDPATGARIAAVFAVTSTASIDFGTQETAGGVLSASDETLSLSTPYTVAYAISLSGFGTQVRTFVKQ